MLKINYTTNTADNILKKYMNLRKQNLVFLEFGVGTVENF